MAFSWFELYSRKRKVLKSHCLLLNSIHPTINSPDVKILLENGKIETGLHCNPTDKRLYLLHSSSHPYHTKKINPLQTCSLFTTYSVFKRSTELERYLTKRGYKNNLVKSQLSRAKLPRNDTFTTLGKCEKTNSK